jgi:TonB family protein
MSIQPTEVYSTLEIARAAGVPVERVIAAVGGSSAFLPHAEAVRLGRALSRPTAGADAPWDVQQSAHSGVGQTTRTDESLLFSRVFERALPVRQGVPLALSSAVHAALLAGAVLLTSVSLSPAAAVVSVETPSEPARLVYLNIPGPGGGGGGGGTRQSMPPPKALREGRRPISSPVPIRRPPPRVEPVAAPPEPPTPPLNSEPLPVLVAPIVTAPADDRDRIGIFEQTRAEQESRGPGEGGGAGSGRGSGLGSGDGTGLGAGSGGGTGGGPYRPGSGVEPPRLLREVKADYTDEARRRGLEGEVVLEIVVRRDGTVGDVKFLRRLGGGLDERAVEAVRQWRFAAATRKGVPVDVIVEAGVEFRLR